ncbi:primosomal protein [Antribacter sp. KLBMP9083]|uniref:Primosomal protein n=1 Tax=Antribacter soli TaxID=2910976 RepID=A0AA41UBM9_9MICO|nr:primosomal protein [Antribacter soli]MCF4121259.1 primosomal protein [Antribacter soli]
MTVDPRAALDRLVAALEAHYHAVATRRSDDDPAVDDAYDVLADAYEVYEDALAQVFGEVTPFYLAEDLDEDEDEEDEELEEADLEEDVEFDDDLADVDVVDRIR